MVKDGLDSNHPHFNLSRLSCFLFVIICNKKLSVEYKKEEMSLAKSDLILIFGEEIESCNTR